MWSKQTQVYLRGTTRRAQRYVLIKRYQCPAMLDCQRKQVEIGDLVMSVDAREIHGGIIA